ncbi:MAG: S-layer homology domain-containing protein [Actinomycetota bacterium]|nr:S-layer homology domain-containing protein [Actinomycetota bacterium]
MPISSVRRRLAGVVAALLAAALSVVPAAAAPDRCGSAPRSDFVDRDEASKVHRESIDCVDFVDIANGQVRNGRRFYLPAEPVTRAQMATFIIQTLIAAGYGDELPSGEATREDPDEFRDIDDSVHRERINQLSRIGVATGFPDATYRPGRTLRRDQMASFLVQAAEWALNRNLEADGGPYFGDVGRNNVHRGNIDTGFEEELFNGRRAPRPGDRNSGEFAPDDTVRREQMASFLTNLLDRVET